MSPLRFDHHAPSVGAPGRRPAFDQHVDQPRLRTGRLVGAGLIAVSGVISLSATAFFVDALSRLG